MDDFERRFADIVKAYEQPTRAQRLRSIRLACEADDGLDALVQNYIAARFERVDLGALDEPQLAEVAELCKGLARQREATSPENVVNIQDYRQP